MRKKKEKKNSFLQEKEEPPNTKEPQEKKRTRANRPVILSSRTMTKKKTFGIKIIPAVVKCFLGGPCLPPSRHPPTPSASNARRRAASYKVWADARDSSAYPCETYTPRSRVKEKPREALGPQE
jgi:hypothetical protein